MGYVHASPSSAMGWDLVDQSKEVALVADDGELAVTFPVVNDVEAVMLM